MIEPRRRRFPAFPFGTSAMLASTVIFGALVWVVLRNSGAAAEAFPFLILLVGSVIGLLTIRVKPDPRGPLGSVIALSHGTSLIAFLAVFLFDRADLNIFYTAFYSVGSAVFIIAATIANIEMQFSRRDR